jgi:hypothetical protein
MLPYIPSFVLTFYRDFQQAVIPKLASNTSAKVRLYGARPNKAVNVRLAEKMSIVGG